MWLRRPEKRQRPKPEKRLKSRRLWRRRKRSWSTSNNSRIR